MPTSPGRTTVDPEPSMRLELMRGSPDEGGEFAGHGGGRHVAVFAAADQFAEDVVQSDLGAPSDGPDGGIDVAGTRFDDARDLDDDGSYFLDYISFEGG